MFIISFPYRVEVTAAGGSGLLCAFYFLLGVSAAVVCHSASRVLAAGRWVKGLWTSHFHSAMELQRAALATLFLLTLLSSGKLVKTLS